ncbi:MAG: MFS transporter [Chloroflexi bacterium]|nr:MFS transporter [Chloroflexota bacterium]MCL5275181.1 MFS transporter [Chloroflexota bacterium]
MEPTYSEKIKRLPWAIANQSLNAVSAQMTFGGPVLLLFLDILGLSRLYIGLLLAFFPLSSLITLVLEPFAARLGYRKTYLVFYTARTLVLALLLFSPFVIAHSGLTGLAAFVSLVMLFFAAMRAVASTGFNPWYQEFVPNASRGQYALLLNVTSNITSALALAAAGVVIGAAHDMNEFMILLSGGIIVSLAADLCAFFIPGGERTKDKRRTVGLSAMLDTLHTREFGIYLIGIALITLGSAPLQFVPLLMKDRIGLPDGIILLLSAVTLIGGLLSSFLWSWATDRWGNKSIIVASLSAVAIMPLVWLAVPANNSLTLTLAVAASIMAGLASSGWSVGSVGLLFNGVVTPERKSDFLATNYAWAGLIGGLGAILAGGGLDFIQTLIRNSRLQAPDAYTLLFALAFLISAASIPVFRQVREYKAIGLRKLLVMVFWGNPIRAIGSLLKYRRARAESERISVTESMGSARSPLNIDELLDAMSDPSFHVRHEAVIAMARMQPDDRIINALIEVLHGNEPDLSISAAWALGRLGDRRAIEPLREAMDSPYPLIRARGARTLAILGDYDVTPLLLDKFETESDEGLRIAYASALGALHSRDSIPGLMAFLYTVRGKDTRLELALAIAQTAGNPDYFAFVARQARTRTGAAYRRALSQMKRSTNLPVSWIENASLIDHCAQTFLQADHGRAMLELADILETCRPSEMGETHALILHECAMRLREFGAVRSEYAVLGLNILRAAIEA